MTAASSANANSIAMPRPAPVIHLWLDYSGTNDRTHLHRSTFCQAARIAIAEGGSLAVTCFSHVLGVTRRIKADALRKRHADLEVAFEELMAHEQTYGGTDFAIVWANALLEGPSSGVVHVVSTDYEWLPPTGQFVEHPSNLGYVLIEQPGGAHEAERLLPEALLRPHARRPWRAGHHWPQRRSGAQRARSLRRAGLTLRIPSLTYLSISPSDPESEVLAIVSFKTVLDQLVETDQEETARLVKAPEGSQSHELSKLPVTMRQWPEGRPVLLPRLAGSRRTIVVLPYEFSPSGRNQQRRDSGAKSLHDGAWHCHVIQSDDDRYPVAGHRIVITESELRRGKLVELRFDYDKEFAR